MSLQVLDITNAHANPAWREEYFMPGEYSHYQNLVAQTDALAARLTDKYAAWLQCRAGCSGCCHHHLSVFPVEAAHLQTAIRALPDAEQDAIREQTLAVIDSETRGEPVACPLLVADKCAVYAARPLICRTQGLPLLYESVDGNPEVDCCPLNFTTAEGVAALDEEHLVPLDRLNLALAAVNRVYCQEHGVDEQTAGDRIFMTDIIARALADSDTARPDKQPDPAAT
ncbi:MAG: YkgJ family cysteine cluster protein [Blastocatellia bacterium]